MAGDTIKASTGFPFDGRVHRDPHELAAALAADWDGARNLLLGAGLDRLREYLGSHGLRDVTQDVAGETVDVHVARLVTVLDPARPPAYRRWTLDADGLNRLVSDATGSGSRRSAALAAIDALGDGRVIGEHATPERRWLADLGRDWLQAAEAYGLVTGQLPGPVSRPASAAKLITLKALFRPHYADELAGRAKRLAGRTAAAEADWFRVLAAAALAMPAGPQRLGALAAVLAAAPQARADARAARADRRTALVARRRRQDRRLIGWTVAACATAVVPTAIGYLIHGRQVLGSDPRVLPGDRLRPLSWGGNFVVEAYTTGHARAMWLAGSAILAMWLAVLLLARSWRQRSGAVVLAVLLVAGGGVALRVAGGVWTDAEHSALNRAEHGPYPYRARYPACSVENYVFTPPGGAAVNWLVGTADTREDAANPPKSCVSIDVYAGWRRTAHLTLLAGEVLATPFIQISGTSPAQSYWAAVVTDATTGQGKYLLGFALATAVSWQLVDPAVVGKPAHLVAGTVAVFAAAPRGVVGIDIATGKRAFARDCPGKTVYDGLLGTTPGGVLIGCSGKWYLVGPNGSINAV